MSAARGAQCFQLPHYGVVCAEVILNGDHTSNFVLDTGSTFTAVSPAVAQQLSLPLARSRPARRTAGPGVVVQHQVYLVRSLQVGPYRVEDLEVITSEMAAALGVGGLLGVNFFARFARISFDTSHMLLTLNH